MSFVGTVGVVAQQGNQAVASAPTGVSIATSSSGNYNNAIKKNSEANCNNDTMSFDGSGFSSGDFSMDVDVSSWEGMYTGCANSANVTFEGYIRATGATSYAWDIVGLTINTSLSNGCSAAIVGTASTDQDEASDITGNIGEYLQISFGGGRGGLTFPADGDVVEFDVSASATNSAGTTTASAVTITYDFVET
tara:strand:- start:866 stop:1444 length:579 start_codon:yes stop_codon:yes gene_type:complete